MSIHTCKTFFIPGASPIILIHLECSFSSQEMLIQQWCHYTIADIFVTAWFYSTVGFTKHANLWDPQGQCLSHIRSFTLKNIPMQSYKMRKKLLYYTVSWSGWPSWRNHGHDFSDRLIKQALHVFCSLTFLYISYGASNYHLIHKVLDT